MSKVIGYVRVSTDQQAESGLSIENQVDKIRGYCSIYDLDLVEIVVDAGESAKSLNRDGIKKVMDLAESGEIEGIVIAKLDRLTRSMKDLHTLLDQVFNKIDLHSVSEKVDTSSASGRLVLNVLMSVAEWEREAIGERTSQALQAKKKRGEKIGNCRYGWKWENGEWIENEREQKVIQLIKELRSDGVSFRAIKQHLEAEGVLNRKGKSKWSLSTINKVMKAS